ncbi:hypothetical protein BDV96DRAFT_361340 [Lophiotrema nucula]|uniref:F-box domain-containing protein n=1 Tax=Lophiotrema nucula TaxID=690887 RepID=A0A6A5ZKB4_9PLEO|nr:hypothetical protein BDV96DRAFT_361340 [Lophiotrema nucula]
MEENGSSDKVKTFRKNYDSLVEEEELHWVLLPGRVKEYLSWLPNLRSLRIEDRPCPFVNEPRMPQFNQRRNAPKLVYNTSLGSTSLERDTYLDLIWNGPYYIKDYVDRQHVDLLENRFPYMTRRSVFRSTFNNLRALRSDGIFLDLEILVGGYTGMYHHGLIHYSFDPPFLFGDSLASDILANHLCTLEFRDFRADGWFGSFFKKDIVSSLDGLRSLSLNRVDLNLSICDSVSEGLFPNLTSLQLAGIDCLDDDIDILVRSNRRTLITLCMSEIDLYATEWAEVVLMIHHQAVALENLKLSKLGLCRTTNRDPEPTIIYPTDLFEVEWGGHAAIMSGVRKLQKFCAWTTTWIGPTL